MTGKDLLNLKKALETGEKLTNAQVAQLAKLRREANAGRTFVGVSKLALSEGEELMDFVWTMMSAVQTNRIILADGSLDAWLQGIFDDHVIVQDGNTGKFFKSNFSRDAGGEIVFEEPVEVRMHWVPVEQKEDADDVERAIQKRAPRDVRVVEITKRDAGKWAGVIPLHLRRRR